MGKRSSPCLSNRAKKLARDAIVLRLSFLPFAEKEVLLVAAIQLHKVFIPLGVTVV